MITFDDIRGETKWYEASTIEPAWQKLPGGPVAENPMSLETWQYMGSKWDASRSIAFHNFRHRQHPDKQDMRVYVWVADHDAGCELVEPWW